MRLLLAPVLLVLAASGVEAQPPEKPAEKRAKWEYAELTYRTIAARPAGKTKDGAEIPATPASVTIRWTTGAADVTVKGWDELIEKVGGPDKKEKDEKKEATRIHALNALGAEGWELVSQRVGAAAFAPGEPNRGFGATSNAMLFKRRAP